MAIATPAPMIKAIHGRIGKLVFYHSRGKQCVRTHVIPRNPDTEAQRSVRRSFADAVFSWQSMSPEERHTYNRKARYMNMSGYNLYISQYMKTRLVRLYSPYPLSAATLPVPILCPVPSVSKPYKAELRLNNPSGLLKQAPG